MASCQAGPTQVYNQAIQKTVWPAWQLREVVAKTGTSFWAFWAIRAAAPPEESVQSAGAPDLAATKAQLLARLDGLQLPANFLDTLIEELGGPEVTCPVVLLWLGSSSSAIHRLTMCFFLHADVCY